MLLVKSLAGGGGSRIHVGSHCFNQESEKKYPSVSGLSHGVDKNLECVVKCISLSSWVLTINEGLEKSTI